MSKYFVNPIRENDGYCEVVEDHEAQFWTVYRRDHYGFGMAMFDLCIKEEAEELIQVLEERDALLTKQNARQDKPIMYAIIDPDGKPYMSEFCVSPNADDLESEVDSLNHDLTWEDSEGGRYVVAPLYLAPPELTVPPEKKLPELMMASYHEAVGWNACRAAMLAQPQSEPQNIPNNIPDGFKLVPVEPTEKMLAAAERDHGLRSTAEGVYWSMLAAVPEGGSDD